ncbi:MAG: hypothetical protein IKK09_03700 [Clostridia bacterium]|nr:hypothetical protein [Clostridia bacterium]
MRKFTKEIERISVLLKSDRKKLIILIVALLGIILIVISSFEDKAVSDVEAIQPQSDFSESEYTAALEKRLEETVSSLYGAGRSRVMVTLECDYETVYARDGSYSKDEASSDEKSEYIIIDSEQQEDGLVLKTVTPRVRGVAVLCEGGNDPYVCEQVSQMLSALLDLGSNRISVSKIQ